MAFLPSTAQDGPTLRRRLAARGLDGVTLLVLPAILFLLALFVYPFLYGLNLSFNPKAGGDWLANYSRFFSDAFLHDTIGKTLLLALPVTLLNLALAIPVAFRVRLLRRQRLLTTILVLPITLGTVLVAQGLLNYLGPQGWFNRALITAGLISSPVKLIHNYWGVFASLLITGFPFTFLLVLSYVTGIDLALERAAATLGAPARSRFRHVFRAWPSPSASASCRPSPSSPRRCCSAPPPARPASSRSPPTRPPSRSTTTRWLPRSR